MGIRHAVAVAGLAVCFSSAVQASSNNPPLFIERSPETIVVDLNKGQRSFEATGKAFDFDSPTVYMFAFGAPSFMHFDVMTGNPASFRLWADDLTTAQLGGYSVDVNATDTSVFTGLGAGVSFSIGIIPEPVVVPLVGSLVLMLMRQRAVRKQ